jgi:mannose-6-phosphate isomerase-like protein (cupin superfamily)
VDVPEIRERQGRRVPTADVAADAQRLLEELSRALVLSLLAKAHVHPSQDERFEVLKGSLMFKIDGKELPAGPGDRVLVPAGATHQFWNAGDEEAHFVCEVRPALKFEQLIETMYSLAADGKTNKNAMPNPLRLAVIARETFDTVQLPFPPAWMQRLGLAVGAPLGRLLGYEATYIPAAVDVPEGEGAPA